MPIESRGGSLSTAFDILKPALPATEWSDTMDGSALDARWTAMVDDSIAVADGVFTLTGQANGFFNNQVYASGSRIDSVFEIEVPPGGGTGVGVGAFTRRQSSGACYFTDVAGEGSFRLFTLSAGGAPAAVATGSLNGYDPNLGYRLRISTYGLAPTLVLAEIIKPDGVLAGAVHVVENTAGLQAAGTCGVVAWGTNLKVANARLDAQPLPVHRRGIVMGMIGDSLYAGFGLGSEADGAAAKEASALATLTGLPVTRVNVAVSGTTVADWINSTNSANLATTIASFKSNGVNAVAIALGTNDANDTNNVTTALFLSRLQTLCTALFAGVPSLGAIILHAPSSHVYGAPLGGTSIARIIDYSRNLPSICTGSFGQGILMGDVHAFDYLVGAATPFTDGLHFTAPTAIAVGGIRARKDKLVLGL